MKTLKNEKGFTLIEMLIVLFIISVLILVTVPNVGRHFKTIDDKGCDALISMVQGQVEAYRVSESSYPTMTELVSKGYLKSDESVCPNGEAFEILPDGQVQISSTSTAVTP